MLDLLADLGRSAAAALTTDTPDASVPAELPVLPASRPEFGDLQIAACLQLAKPLGRKPRDLALLVRAALAAHPAIAQAEIAGPGYVNLTLRTAWLEQRVAAVGEDPHLGLARRPPGERVVIDFSSPNIAKPMLVHHLRSTIIGDALQRILRAVGYEVIADNHLGDWGTQFGKLIVAYHKWLDPEAYARDPIGELVRIYIRFATEEKEQARALGLGREPLAPSAEPGDDAEGGEAEPTADVTPLLAEARAELAQLHRGDPQNLALWREFVDVSLQVFARTYSRLGVTFDVQLGESFYNGRLAALVEGLLLDGIAEVSQGAAVCPVAGESVPLLIRKGDGSFLYGTTDLATLEYRIKTWGPARILYVVGAPQQLHFRLLFAVARKMGVTCGLEHIPFGSILFPGTQPGTWVMGSTRGGTTARLDDLLDEAISKAERVTREHHPELPDAQVKEVARVVGIGAVKYNDLCHDRGGDIRFDIEKAVSFDGNTAPYLQYAYARLRSIGRRGASEGRAAMIAPITLAEPAERTLARRLLDYPGVIEHVVRTARPHVLAEYLYELAVAVNKFYSEVPVLKAATAAQRDSRLRLLEVVAKTLRHGLGLLGIEVVEEM
ncbi:MAG TPA: arginine--tRNA ligase [Polyangia bacterium]|jgi:arginyl-tRNA synthetase